MKGPLCAAASRAVAFNQDVLAFVHPIYSVALIRVLHITKILNLSGNTQSRIPCVEF